MYDVDSLFKRHICTYDTPRYPWKAICLALVAIWMSLEGNLDIRLVTLRSSKPFGGWYHLWLSKSLATICTGREAQLERVETRLRECLTLALVSSSVWYWPGAFASSTHTSFTASFCKCVHMHTNTVVKLARNLLSCHEDAYIYNVYNS